MIKVFDFRCNSCDEVFERFIKVSKSADVPASPVCPACGSADTEPVPGGMNFRLEGSGWAKDGYQ